MVMFIEEEPLDQVVDQVEQIQVENSPHGQSTPIFLIHDGGGTTFPYHCLESLGRSVYGIANPHFNTGGAFDGGVPEVGRLYADMIRHAATRPDFPVKPGPDGRVPVLLGGWSFGGMASLEVAHVLAADKAVRVMGILMVDSPYPGMTKPANGVLARRTRKVSSKNEIMVERCMSEARRMLDRWDLPAWEQGSRPPAVMLRATSSVPSKGPGVDRVDVCRSESSLGWSRYHQDMFESVLEVDGNHFDLFSFGRVADTTKVMRQGLNVLDHC
ncbi:hypothetical protein CDD82_1503 [Ophiocordyceps australis]|uniref:Thioesterase domain-containing protein n=1 Tax=Ophiocordyceps australis TaxID=1399860 RepID=A0A2C5XC79_9HYPO|nr:hypothetical protein CDD82_1503 [Ophiocordyceps australis]